MQISNEEFKQCLGSFVSGVAIVAIIDEGGEPQGVTVSSFSSLSLNPPMVAFNLGKKSHLYNKIVNSKSFSVNILSHNQAVLSNKFSKNSTDRWRDVQYTLGLHGCPILDSSIAFIECFTASIYDGGDHSIITGKVINLQRTHEARPLIYYMGGYYCLGEKII